MNVRVVRDGSLTWWYLTKEAEMPHSDHIDRWQRERDDALPDPQTPAEHIARMREPLDNAEAREWGGDCPACGHWMILKPGSRCSHEHCQHEVKP